MAPEAGFEPATNWLTANCATAALLRIKYYDVTQLTRSYGIIADIALVRQVF